MLELVTIAAARLKRQRATTAAAVAMRYNSGGDSRLKKRIFEAKKKLINLSKRQRTAATNKMQSLPFALRAYIGTTMAYGFARSATYDYEGTKFYYNEKTGRGERKERLFVDKIGRVAGHSVAAVGVWPCMVWGDLATLECLAKGKDPREYK